MVVDQLRTETAVAQATPAAAGQAPPSNLARLLSQAAQEVLAPRMATAFRLRRRGRFAHIWFGPPQLLRQLGGFQAARRVRHEVAVAPHSPKLDRPVACESSLEAGFYRFLDQAEVVWSYQEQPVSIPVVIDGAQRRYHPDVLVVLVDGRVVLAELKPRLQWALFDNLRKWAALADYCRQHGYGMFIGDCHRALQRALTARPPEAFSHDLLALADRGGAGWASCRRLLVAHGATSSDLNAVVLGHGLELRVNPFVLRRLWGPAGEEVQEFLGLLRAGLRANAEQARLAARLQATER
jgi:hypothetical protein